jgi:hypothetical protein
VKTAKKKVARMPIGTTVSFTSHGRVVEMVRYPPVGRRSDRRVERWNFKTLQDAVKWLGYLVENEQ